MVEKETSKWKFKRKAAMSYCRFSEGDVYMYPNGEGVSCCLCSLEECGMISFSDAEEALAHLNKHKSAGDRVPARAFIRLQEEIADQKK